MKENLFNVDVYIMLPGLKVLVFSPRSISQRVSNRLRDYFLSSSIIFCITLFTNSKREFSTKGPVMDSSSVERSFLKSFYLYHACSHCLANSQY